MRRKIKRAAFRHGNELDRSAGSTNIPRVIVSVIHIASLCNPTIVTDRVLRNFAIACLPLPCSNSNVGIHDWADWLKRAERIVCMLLSNVGAHRSHIVVFAPPIRCMMIPRTILSARNANPSVNTVMARFETGSATR
jgi:hypothetical protein